LWDRILDKRNHNWVNDWVLTMVGTDKRELSFDDLKNSIHPDDRHKWADALEAHIDGITTKYKFDYRLWHNKDRRYRWIESRGCVTRNSKGVATHISGTMLDVTARKEAESNFERLVNTDQNMVFIKDHEGRFLFINRALARLYGTTPSAALGKKDEEF